MNIKPTIIVTSLSLLLIGCNQSGATQQPATTNSVSAAVKAIEQKAVEPSNIIAPIAEITAKPSNILSPIAPKAKASCMNKKTYVFSQPKKGFEIKRRRGGGNQYLIKGDKVSPSMKNDNMTRVTFNQNNYWVITSNIGACGGIAKDVVVTQVSCTITEKSPLFKHNGTPDLMKSGKQKYLIKGDKLSRTGKYSSRLLSGYFNGKKYYVESSKCK